MAGTTAASACGNTILRCACHQLRPMLAARRVDQLDQSRLDLPALHRLQTAAHDLRHVRRREQRDADDDADQHIGRVARRHKQRKHERCHEQHRDQRHPSHHFDVGGAQSAQRRHRAAPAQSDEDRERKCEYQRCHRQQHRQGQAAPQIGGDARQAAATAHEPDEDGKHCGPQQRQPRSPQQAIAAGHHQTEQESRRSDGPPSFARRVAAQQNEAALFRNHAPASADAAHRLALVGVGTPDGFDQAPVEKGRCRPRQQAGAQQRGQRARGAREKILPQPRTRTRASRRRPACIDE